MIHAFWLPQIQRQIDANPGQDNAVFTEATKPGIYDGDCYEYCGAAHAWMKFRAVVQTPAQFAAWVKNMKASAAKPTTALTKRGESGLLARNVRQLPRHPGHGGRRRGGPESTHLASRWAAAGGALPITETSLTQWIRDPQTYKPGVIMPGYPFLSNKDIHALAAYLMSLK